MILKPILIKNGRVVDPANGIDFINDVLIIDQKIAAVSQAIKDIPAESIIINADEKYVLPGLVDMHTHLRDPGRSDEETIASGSRAAAAGGFTSIACMANTNPVADDAAVIEYIVSKAKAEGLVNVFPIGAVTKGQLGEELAEMGKMIEAGAVAFSDDGNPIENADVFRHGIEYASQFGKILICHCEEKTLSKGGSMNEGYLSTIFGLPGIPKESETVSIYRAIQLAKEYGRIHIAHVSCAESVELIRQAKTKGVPVTCETAPHYFTLTEDEVEGYNTNAKMNPPLRTADDVSAVVEGLRDGTIDCIATDHAPHSVDEKNVEFSLAAFGIVGLETAFPIIFTELIDTKVLTLFDAVAKLTLNPAKIIGINKGTLSVGADADVTIIDPDRNHTINISKFISKSKNSPFDGWKVKSAVDTVIVGGRVVVHNSRLNI